MRQMEKNGISLAEAAPVKKYEIFGYNYALPPFTKSSSSYVVY